uniref:Uncharacterized protein n=1 Tax=Anguilla anguilla TaxID=7936 RepID=A0A0E9T320_ANGAN
MDGNENNKRKSERACSRCNTIVTVGNFLMQF